MMKSGKYHHLPGISLILTVFKLYIIDYTINHSLVTITVSFLFSLLVKVIVESIELLVDIEPYAHLPALFPLV